MGKGIFAVGRRDGDGFQLESITTNRLAAVQRAQVMGLDVLGAADGESVADMQSVEVPKLETPDTGYEFTAASDVAEEG